LQRFQIFFIVGIGPMLLKNSVFSKNSEKLSHRALGPVDIQDSHWA
jgi:hypothetical protein